MKNWNNASSANAARTALLQRVITAQEDERQRIARELHDSLGQVLVGLSLRVVTAYTRAPLPVAVQAELDQIHQIITQIDREVDRLTMELRPPILSDMGLRDALASYLAKWQVTSGIPVDLVTMGYIDRALLPVVETTVYRIVQEALTNILKHAYTTIVSVIVEQRYTTLHVVIEDNGAGFETGWYAAAWAGSMSAC